MKHITIGMILTVLVVSNPARSYAQTARPGSNGANAQQLLQLQQLASERTALQAEVTKLKAELEKARRDLDDQKRQFRVAGSAADQRSRTAEEALARSQSETERAKGDLTRERERMQELVTRFRETATTLGEVEKDRAAAKQSLVERERELKTCVDRNQALYKLNAEVLAKFEDQGFWSSLARREPFTQLKRVELENLIDGYRGSARDQLLPAASPTSSR